MLCLTVLNTDVVNFKLEVLQGISIDSKIKGGAHVGNSIHHLPYSFARRCLAPLALQPRMGLIPERNLRDPLTRRFPASGFSGPMRKEESRSKNFFEEEGEEI